MKRYALLAALLLSTASAAKLYTITVKFSQPVEDAQILLGPVNAKPKDNFTKVGYKNGSTFQLPAGKYQVFVDKKPKSTSVTTFELSSKDFTVTSNMTVTVPIKMTKVMPKDGDRAFSGFLIDIVGTYVDCYQPSVNAVCAETDKSYKIVQGYAQLHPELDQAYAWISMGNNAYLGQFVVGSHLYSMILFARPDGSTSITWSIQ